MKQSCLNQHRHYQNGSHNLGRRGPMSDPTEELSFSATDAEAAAAGDEEVHHNFHRFKSDSDAGGGKSAAAKRFSFHRSTEEHHSVAVNGSASKGCYGAYGEMRKKLDYSYHVHYRKERQWLHDAIIEDSLVQHEEDATCLSDSTSLPTKPWLILTVGVRGVGKHYVIRDLVATDQLCLRSFLCIDTDLIRHYLPEYSTYLRECPERVDALTRGEAGYISETLTLATLSAGRNAIYHCSLKDHRWYQDKFIPMLRSQFTGLKVGLIHVTASPNLVLERSRARAKTTGRIISEDAVLEALHTLIPQSVEQLESSVDALFTIKNDGEEPQLLGGGDWQIFRDTFCQQKCEHQSPPHSIPTTTAPPNLPKMPQRSSQRAITTGRLRSRDVVYRSQSCMMASSDQQRRSSLMKRRFNALTSSEDNHAVNNADMYGHFAHIRVKMDYSYHKNYSFERQLFQDAIIKEFLGEAVITDVNGEVCTTPTKPWIVFTAGAMGAGKGYAMRKLVEKGRFPLMAFVRVDPDAIRRYLPEFHLYIEESPEHAGELTNKEAGYIAEILTLAGLQAGKNVIVDGSLRQAGWYRDYFMRLRTDFADLRIAIIHVTAPRQAIFQRATERAIQTGRVVPRKLLVETMEQVPRSVKELAPLVDYHVDLNNAPDAPDIELMAPGESWESFTSQWIQTCAWVPRKNREARLLEKAIALEDKLVNGTEK